MESILDDVIKLLEMGKGDIGRLESIKKTLKQNKMLYVSDRQYITKLSQQYLESSIKNQFESNAKSKVNKQDYPSSKNISSSIPNNFCTTCGNQLGLDVKSCSRCNSNVGTVHSINNPRTQNNYNNPLIVKSPGKIWYLLPLFFGIIGGIIGWAVIKDRNPKRARKILFVGFIPMIIAILIMVILFVFIFGQLNFLNIFNR